MNVLTTTWTFFRALVCLLSAALLVGGACYTIWHVLQGGAPLADAFYSLVAVGFAVWFMWFALQDTTLGAWMFVAVGEAGRFYLGCAVTLALSVFLGYLCVHGLLTDQAPSFGRHVQWFSRAAHPVMFWVSMVVHALFGALLVLGVLLGLRYRYKRRGKD